MAWMSSAWRWVLIRIGFKVPLFCFSQRKEIFRGWFNDCKEGEREGGTGTLPNLLSRAALLKRDSKNPCWAPTSVH
eukprot:904243-Pelagomonas_calceolata.AAC.1